jgi:hypothetical protein
MKHFLFLLMCLLLVRAQGQVNQSTNGNTIKPSSTNSNSNNSNSNQLELEEESEKKELDVKSTKNNVKYKKMATQQGPAAKKQEMQSVSTTFLTQKKKASTQSTQRSPTPVQQAEMNEAVAFYAANASGSFEYHYFSYVAGNYDVSLFNHLQKAQELRPTNSDVLIQLAAYHVILNQGAKAKEYLAQLGTSGRIAQEVIAYDRDVLSSVPANGVLLTHGFDDSYGSLYLQLKEGFRKDVRILSLDFMQSQAYRESLVKQGFALPASKTVDVGFLKEFCRLNGNSQLHLSLTFPKPYFTAMADKLQVLGLTFKYDTKPESTFNANDKLWKEIVQKQFAQDAVTEKAKQLSANYLPMLLYLRENYQGQKNAEAVAELDKVIDRIAVQSNKYSKVTSLKKQN